MREYRKFDGYDYAELIEAWNLSFPDPYELEDIFDEDEQLFYEERYYLKEFIENFLTAKLLGESGRRSKFTQRAITDLKMYLEELGKCELSYFNPVWKGMLEIEDDFTFLQVVESLIGHMWC